MLGAVKIVVESIVTIVVAETEAQPLAAAIKFVTIYVPEALEDKSILPDDTSAISNPGVELKSPAVAPVARMAVGLVPFWQ